MNDDLQATRDWLDHFASPHHMTQQGFEELVLGYRMALDEIEKLRFTLEGVATEELVISRTADVTTEDFEDIGEIRGYGRDYDKYEAEERRQRYHPLYPEVRR